MNSYNRQRGLGYVGWMVTIATIGFVIVTAVRIIPPYAQHATVVDIVKSLELEGIERKSVGQIRGMMEKRLNINMVRGISRNDIKISKKGKKVLFDIDYTVQEHLVANIDVLIIFKKQIEFQF